MSKPCDQCPWIKGSKLHEESKDPALQEAMQAGRWFCCHVHLGTCHGAALMHEAYKRQVERESTAPAIMHGERP